MLSPPDKAYLPAKSSSELQAVHGTHRLTHSDVAVWVGWTGSSMLGTARWHGGRTFWVPVLSSPEDGNPVLSSQEWDRPALWMDGV